MTRVRFDHITKHFGDTVALDDINLEIEAGELFFLLGPSGCGKSTLLRLIAGLHDPTAGRIWFNDRDVTALGTEKRNAVMCFQSYALWPHMTVADNVRFGLKVRGAARAQQDTRVDEVLRLVQMDEYAARKPNQLSGGQQQRVALARALAVSPDCLLLDEPLSNLDAKLRHEMRSEIRRICKTAGLHDDLRHARPEGSAERRRPHRRDAGRAARAGGPAGRLVPPPGEQLRRRLHRAHEPAPRHVGRPRGRPRRRARPPAGSRCASPTRRPRATGEVLVSIRPEQMQSRPRRPAASARTG
jgi:iron(III) transport system ATP-binding protein